MSRGADGNMGERYKVVPRAAADPLFAGPTVGDLTLRPGSPCAATATALRLEMMSGAAVDLPAGINVGWDQGGADPFTGLRARAPSVTPLDAAVTVA